MSLLDLVSEANIKLGRKVVASLSNGSREAQVYPSLLQPALDDLISRGNWNFASTTVALVDDEVEPGDPRYGYTFSLPDDWMKTRFCMDEGGSRLLGTSYIIEGQKLITNESAVIMKYVRRFDTDDLLTSPIWFQELWVTRLARDAAEPITGQPDLTSRFTGDLAEKWRNAQVLDGQTEPLVRLLDDTMLLHAHRGARAG